MAIVSTEWLTDPNDPRWRCRRIIQNALSDLVVQMAAVVVRLDVATRFVCVGVKGVEVRADAFYGGEVLDDSIR